jgi:hypothetical protein
LSDCAVKEAQAIYDIAEGVQAAINELSDAGKDLYADTRSDFVFSAMPPGTVILPPKSVPPPALTSDAFGGGVFGGGGQPSYGGFGGGVASQLPFGEFGGGVFGGGQSSNRYQV